MKKIAWLTLSLLLLALPPAGAQSAAGAQSVADARPGSAAGPAAATLADDPRVATVLDILEKWIDTQIDYEDIPGVSAGIVHDQDLVWAKGFGYAHVAERVPAAPDTIYSICSISKLFTSIGVMQLRDEGLLRLDDPISSHLPWFDIQDRFPETGNVDIQGVLTHSAGLPRESDHPYWTGPDYPFPTRDEVIDRIALQEELYPADTYYQYSNLGLSLAGEVVAAASGQPYADYVQEHILDPLGLDSTSPEIPEEHRGGRLATPYSRPDRDQERTTIDFYQVRGIAPAAGYASTVEDLARFASWQFRLLDNDNVEVLHPTTLREMQRVHFVSETFSTYRGLGFSVSRRDGDTYVGHGGSCPGYRTTLSMHNEDKVAVIFMTNAGDVSPGAFASEIFDLIRPAIRKALDDPGGAVEPDPELQRYVGRYDRPLGGETHVLIKDGKLATLSLPTMSPSLTLFEHVGEHTFRRIRDDGELAETTTFEVGPDGEVTRMVRNTNYSIRVRD